MNIFGDGAGGSTTSDEGIHCFGRHGVDGMFANQFIDIEGRRIGGVLRAGASPQWTLYSCALRGKDIPASAAKSFLEVSISGFGIGYSDFPLQFLVTTFFEG